MFGTHQNGFGGIVSCYSLEKVDTATIGQRLLSTSRALLPAKLKNNRGPEGGIGLNTCSSHLGSVLCLAAVFFLKLLPFQGVDLETRLRDSAQHTQRT